MNQAFDVVELATTYANKSAQDILKLAFSQFGDDLWISFSGAEDVVLVDMAWKLNKNVKVFSLDTGRLHPETYRFIEQVREFYKIDIELISPDQSKLEPFVKEKGLFSFYKDGHGECCGVRKIEPLRLQIVRRERLGHRPTPRPEPRHPQPGGGAGDRHSLFHPGTHPVQVQPVGANDQRRDLGLYPHAGTALQQPAWTRLYQHRLRAMHPAGVAQPTRARRPLVVGRGHAEGMRAACGEHHQQGVRVDAVGKCGRGLAPIAVCQSAYV